MSKDTQSVTQHNNNNNNNKNRAIVDIKLRLRCAIISQPIIDSSNACNEESAHLMCTPLHGPVQFTTHRGVRFVGHMFSPFLNISPINAKLTSLSCIHTSKSLTYLFLHQHSRCNSHCYHSNNSYDNVHFSNSSHYLSNFSDPLLVYFARYFEIVSQNYAL